MQSYGLNRQNFLKEKTFALGAGYYILVSLAIILFASPLFRVLGFEYSGIIALFASIHLLFYSGNKAFQIKEIRIWKIVSKLSLPVFVLSSIPLVVSIISSLLIPNCSLWDGIIFYIEIVYPTALIGMLCGIWFGIFVKSKKRMNFWLAFFWIITLVVSLLPGYFSGRIYTYGWQYGYFPGFVWDEAMELTAGYWESRIFEFGVIFLLYFIDWNRGKISKQFAEENLKKQPSAWRYFLTFLLITILQTFTHGLFNDGDIERFLPQTFDVLNTKVHYKAISLTNDEWDVLMCEIEKYENEIDSVYKIHSQEKIDIYVFPNSDDLYNFVGTSEASISKPWRHAIYIAKPNLHSLKHELAHILLAPYGSFPFDISWSTGLTEGAAVAIEDDYDGIESADYFSTKMLQMNLASGVAQVMQPSGFLSSAPTQSYVLSGSFTKYLLECCGAEKFLEVYKDRNFEKHFGKTVTSLESDWKQWLKKNEKPMDHYDSLRTLFYFKRTSVLKEPCLRRIGKLFKYADQAFKEKNYKLADSLYLITEKESGRLKAIRGRVLSQLFLNNPAGALAILDTTASGKETNNLSALRMLRGDAIALATRDLAKASGEWDEAMKLELGESYFLASFMRKYFLGETKDIAGAQKILRDLYGIEDQKDKYQLVFSVPPSDSTNKAFLEARLFLYTSYIEKTGMLAQAYSLWEKQLNIPPRIDNYDVLPPGVSGEDLFLRLIQKKFSHYKEVFGKGKEK